MRYILASASPRRQELLHRVLTDFEVIISNFNEEEIVFDGDCSQYVINIAEGKAKTISKMYKDSIIIAADTIVTLDDKILGKPKDKEDAFNMLNSLSNRTHKVYTGVAIINTANNKVIKESICTEVKFSKLSEDEINKYIESGDSFDKAGAYGIQGFAGVFVEEIRGCYYNVVGLPLNYLNKALKQII